jgi:hypothetical protein
MKNKEAEQTHCSGGSPLNGGLGWQSIETAPKDGTSILGWNSDHNRHEVVYWNGGDYWCSFGYYLCRDDDGNSIGYDLSISHWMPLIELPNALLKRGGT